MSNFRRDTGRAQLPALPPVNAQDPALRNWISAVAERLEVREGTRGNKFERAVTVREIETLTGGLVSIYETGKGQVAPGSTSVSIGGGLEASIAIDRFIESIKATRLYKDLIKRLDDPSRFDDIVEPVRNILLKSIADEAAKRGADIRRLEVISQETASSLAIAVEEITAAIANNAAGVRQTQYAFADANRAQAGQITQLEASLGNYYQDGSPGRAILEQQMNVYADRIAGLRAQYTLKVQAGGALAGFGISATEVNGVPSSAFIIMADKFAIVAPNYSGGLTNTPDNNLIPFGVDANGIYMNTNVYIRGNMRVDTGGRTLIEGLRGSVALALDGSAWSDAEARQLVWQYLGKTGSAPNDNHLVIGDMVTRSNATSGGKYSEVRQWNGGAWVVPGAVFNGSMLVNGSVAASKINTQGLEIKDARGNVVFQSGVSNKLSVSYLDGLGALATSDTAKIGENVTFPNGEVMKTTDFVNKLAKITSGNIANFMGPTAITEAYIGVAAVNTLSIKGDAVTVPASGTSGVGATPFCSLTLDQPGTVYVTATLWMYETSASDGGAMNVAFSAQIDSSLGSGGFVWQHCARARHSSVGISAKFDAPAGTHTFAVSWANVNDVSPAPNFQPQSGSIMVIGTKR